jgi:RHS repeat-associated protein
MASNLLCTTAPLSVLLAKSPDGRVALAYTPFGHHASGSPPDVALGFNGERPQPPTGHYLLGNGYRAFNPTLMRFNSPDSWSPFGDGGLNAYAYCAGDPVNNIDPDGHWGSLAYVARFIGKLKSGRADRLALRPPGIDPVSSPVASPRPGPSVAPVSAEAKRVQVLRERVRSYRATAQGRRVNKEGQARYQAKLKDRVKAFDLDEANGLYAATISNRDFHLVPLHDRPQVFAKAKTIYGFEQQPSVDKPFFAPDGRLDVHHFDLAIAAAVPRGGRAVRAARIRRINYILKHASAVRTDG